MQEEVSMTYRELDRLTVIKQVISGNITQRKASEVLKVSERQVRRLQRHYILGGPGGLVSKRRGARSNRRLCEGLKKEAINLIREHFYDYGPTLASEKLKEYFGINISKETARQWMIAEGIWLPNIKPEPKIHPLRERRPCFGELIQIDGSDHAWFEGRGPQCTLLVFIDDATSIITELFFTESETTLGYFEAFKHHTERYGVPRATYSDKHGVFKVNHPESKSGTGLTQFGRALSTLGVELIFAQSPQAKGRVEKANRTLQDRLVKELRYHGISSIEEGNAFLQKFRQDYNKRFARRPASDADLHRPLTQPEISKIDVLFSIQTQRTISKDMLIRHNKNIFRIIAPGQVNRLSQAKVTVCEGLSGKIKILYKNQSLHFEVYKNHLHVDQLLSRKGVNSYLNKIKRLEKACWHPTHFSPMHR